MERKQALYVKPGEVIVIDGQVWGVMRVYKLNVLEWYGRGVQPNYDPPNVIKLECRSIFDETVLILNIFRGWHELLNVVGSFVVSGPSNEINVSAIRV